MNKKILSLTTLALICCTAMPLKAHAGKPERDKADELKPQIEEVQGEVKQKCGCDKTVEVAWDTFASVDDMARIADNVKSVGEAAAAFCEKEADKKVFCDNVEKFHVHFKKGEGEATLDGKVIHLTGDDSIYTSADQVVGILNKF